MNCSRDMGIILCIVLLSSFVYPVQANGIVPTYSVVFFEKNGAPFDENVQFAINCYGYRIDPYKVGHVKNQSELYTSNISERIYSFSATCPHYGCKIYEQYFMYMAESKRCDLLGVAQGKNFTLNNFSNMPYTLCKYPLHQYDVQKGKWSNISYYNFTPEYDACIKRIQPLKDQCRQYTYTCDIQVSGECGGTVMSGHEDVFLNDFDAFKKCISPYDQEHEQCEKYLAKVDPSSMYLLSDNHPASRYCESRFTIPSDNATPNIATYLIESSYVPQSPVESLYCSIVELFGGRCE